MLLTLRLDCTQSQMQNCAIRDEKQKKPAANRLLPNARVRATYGLKAVICYFD